MSRQDEANSKTVVIINPEQKKIRQSRRKLLDQWLDKDAEALITAIKQAEFTAQHYRLANTTKLDKVTPTDNNVYVQLKESTFGNNIAYRVISPLGEDVTAEIKVTKEQMAAFKNLSAAEQLQAILEETAKRGHTLSTIFDLINGILDGVDIKEDRKGFDYVNIDKESVENPINKAARKGHAVVLEYIFNQCKTRHLPMPSLAIKNNAPTLLVVAKEIVSLSANRDHSTAVRLYQLKEVLVFLLQQDAAISTIDTQHQGHSFDSVFLSYLTKNKGDIFETQNHTILQMLHAMIGDKTAAMKSDKIKLMQFEMVKMLKCHTTIPDQKILGKLTWLAYLYRHDSTESDHIKPAFLKKLIEVGYDATLSDSAIVNEMIENEQWDLCIALLEGEICRSAAHASDDIQQVFTAHEIMKTLLVHCKDHYLADQTQWQLHFQVIHFLIAFNCDSSLLQSILRDAKYAELTKLLLAIKPDAEWGIYRTFNEMVQEIQLDIKSKAAMRIGATATVKSFDLGRDADDSDAAEGNAYADADPAARAATALHVQLKAATLKPATVKPGFATGVRKEFVAALSALKQATHAGDEPKADAASDHFCASSADHTPPHVLAVSNTLPVYFSDLAGSSEIDSTPVPASTPTFVKDSSVTPAAPASWASNPNTTPLSFDAILAQEAASAAAASTQSNADFLAELKAAANVTAADLRPPVASASSGVLGIEQPYFNLPLQLQPQPRSGPQYDLISAEKKPQDIYAVPAHIKAAEQQELVQEPKIIGQFSDDDAEEVEEIIPDARAMSIKPSKKAVASEPTYSSAQATQASRAAAQQSPAATAASSAPALATKAKPPALAPKPVSAKSSPAVAEQTGILSPPPAPPVPAKVSGLLAALQSRAQDPSRMQHQAVVAPAPASVATTPGALFVGPQSPAGLQAELQQRLAQQTKPSVAKKPGQGGQ